MEDRTIFQPSEYVVRDRLIAYLERVSDKVYKDLSAVNYGITEEWDAEVDLHQAIDRLVKVLKKF